jgi:hypothetical protein
MKRKIVDYERRPARAVAKPVPRMMILMMNVRYAPVNKFPQQIEIGTPQHQNSRL